MPDWFYSKSGQQQGPVTESQLKQMAASGQLLPDDLVWKDGMAEWAKASQLKGVFAAPAPGAPPALPQGAPPMQMQSANQQFAAAFRTSAPPAGTSGIAIASLVCGILFCIPFSSLLAIIFGIIGIVQTSDGRRRGRGLAIAGLVLGILSIPLSISILLPALNKARQQAQQIKSAANERQIGLAIVMYANSNHGEFPPDMVTLAKAQSLSPAVFVDPASDDTPAANVDALESGGHNSYIYLGAGLTNPPANQIILFEKPNPHGNRGANVLYGDGSVQFVNKANLPTTVGSGNN